MKLPDLDELREKLSYDPETGKLTWLVGGHSRRIGMQAGALDHEGYRLVSFNYKTYRAHRLIWLMVHGEWPSQQIDHVNGDRDDNRLSNLRLATPNQNMWNSKKQRNNKSGLKGVSWNARDEVWQAQIKVRRRSIALGTFKDKFAAAEAYRVAALKYHGDFARFD